MKTMKRFVTIFAMLVMVFTVFAGAAEYTQYIGPIPFNENNEYTGINGSTTSSTVFNIVNYGMQYDATVSYGITPDNTLVYVIDGDGVYTGSMEPYYGDWTYTDVYSIPQFVPAIETLDMTTGVALYVWRDKSDNFWATVACGPYVFHIDNQKLIYDSEFNLMEYEDYETLEAAMNSIATDTPVTYNPEYLQSDLQLKQDDVPKPGGSSFPTGIIAVVVIVIIGAGVVSFIRKKNRPATATIEGAPMDEQPVEKSNTEKAAEAAAKAANMANDAATKATDAAKIAAFMAKEKANEFSKAFKDAQARQKAAEKIICSNCGTANEAGSKFCANCGAKLGDQ